MAEYGIFPSHVTGVGVTPQKLRARSLEPPFHFS